MNKKWIKGIISVLLVVSSIMTIWSGISNAVDKDKEPDTKVETEVDTEETA